MSPANLAQPGQARRTRTRGRPWGVGRADESYLPNGGQQRMLHAAPPPQNLPNPPAPYGLVTSPPAVEDVTYEFWRSALLVSGARQEARTAKFESLRAQWQSETTFTTSLTDRVLNGAYQQIIGMGAAVLGDILRSLVEEPDHWFWALSAISGEDPAAGMATFAEAREAWLRWGRDRGHLT